MYEYRTLAECEALAFEYLLAGVHEAMEQSGQSIEIDKQLLSDFAHVVTKAWIDEQNGYDSIGYIARHWGISVNDLDEGHLAASDDSLPLAAAPEDTHEHVRVSDVSVRTFTEVMKMFGKYFLFDLFLKSALQGDVRLAYLAAACVLIVLPIYIDEYRKVNATLPLNPPGDTSVNDLSTEQRRMLEETAETKVKAYLASRPII